ncbi:FCD domain-containing protein [Mycolicibacterium austroafricanum]|uniref:FCD domain-containing protein n=1 Tax=Mycolicibacterium austroafricanum TaxID=39687 RepID=A0ABT8H8Q6_MYCAO|nr:FCD domain-containing protein [Mycolicibacterium austroafricanum]MDN4517147.1 FCD domain-containing protein [Mycolicibacterium austroafricanum]
MAEIESRLLTKQLRAGDRLPPERQFAEALGVSRGAVREALRILEAVGVIEAGTGSGPCAGSVIVRDSAAGMAMVLRLHMQVASFSHDDLLQCRQTIGQLAARTAAASASGDDIAALRSLAERMRDVPLHADFDELESEFHARLVGASGNVLAVMLSRALTDVEKNYRATTSVRPAGAPDQASPTAQDYTGVVDAIAAGDGETAAALLTGILGQDGGSAVDLALKRAG